VWIGSGIVGAVIFGPTAMQPVDVTQLALHVPTFGIAIAITWLLLFAPTARVLVRAEGATYLRSLPAPRWTPRVIAASALVWLQLPWLALWLLGEGVHGLAIVLAFTAPIVALASWRPRPPRAGWPRWRGDRAALRGVYLRALRRRAGDALVRHIGLSILAGLAAGLFIHNNAFVDERAAVLGGGVIAIVLVPGAVGTLLPLVDVHHASAPLASSLGMSAPARVAVLASVVAIVYAGGAAIAAAAAALELDVVTLAWLAAAAVALALAMSLVATRMAVWADRGEPVADAPKDIVSRNDAAVRVVIGGVVAAALAVICLGALGIAGVLAMLVIGIAAVLTTRPS